MRRDVLIFDMDGVLVDVSESYRSAIQETVHHFTGRRPTPERIQEYKNLGGFNDDWDLSHRIISDFGVNILFEDVVAQFNDLFLGDGSNGLILRERWIAAPGALEQLATRFQLAIFTGRRTYEVTPTLCRFAAALKFDPIVTAEMVAALKPAPDGLLFIASAVPDRELWYIGDAVDDARSARAAGVRFIGIAAPGTPRYDELVEALKNENAFAILDDINQLEAVLPK